MKTVNLISEETEREAQQQQAESIGQAGRDDKSEVDREHIGYNDSMVIPEANQDPYKRRLANPTRGIIKKLARAIKNRIQPPPSPEDIAAMDDKKKAKLLEKTLRYETNIAAQRISRALADLRFAYLKRDMAGNITASRYIQFDHAYAYEDSIWLHVDMHLWPYGVNSDDIIKQEVINHLSRSVGHKVNVRSTPEKGIWYIIERASGMMGIPVEVPLSEMWARFPSTANNFTIPIGMSSNRKPEFDNITDMVHIMVAGQTGGGKSTFLNVLICTLITRNTPEQLQLLLMDMKAGLEFQYYEHLPHLLTIPEIADTGIIDDADRVSPALKWLVGVEAKRRLEMIRASGHKDITGYNARHKKKLTRILVIVDEWAAARLGAGGKDAETELVKAVQLLRAAGIHMIVCTQAPSKDVLGMLARANLPTRLAFSCSDMPASIMIVGDGSALNLGNPGRAIYKRGGKNYAVQTPWISEEAVKEIVAGVLAGAYDAQTIVKKNNISITEILEWARQQNNGRLRFEEVFTHFQTKITAGDLKAELKALDNTIVELSGDRYRVQPGRSIYPRRLVAINENDEGINNDENSPVDNLADIETTPAENYPF